VRSDTAAAVRQGEELDLYHLRYYLRGRIEGDWDDLSLEQFPGGHSNLTYLLKSGGREFVLRRAPLGPIAPKAHDMAREYAVLNAVHSYFPEAPRVYHLCEDPAVIGAVFFLMDRRRGSIIRDSVPPGMEGNPEYARTVSQAFVDTQARLHAIDIRQTGLIALGKPEGFLERQVRGWADRWQRSKTEELSAMDSVIAWLIKHLPRSTDATLVHNDYKLDNVMLRDGAPGTIEAVLDWEMSTVGDPLADVGLTLCYWVWANAPEVRAAGIPDITSQPGWYTREEFIERYAAGTGRDLAKVGYYEVLGVFKLAVIIQQIYYRFWRGQTGDRRFQNFGERVCGLVNLAASMTERFS
jgi:aminoglycoside phosphotransferase (APT) family kinase protein